MHVLIADDDPTCRGLIQDLLESWDFTVSVAADGEEAMRAINADPRPAIAVLDWMMPRLDGYEVCRRVKQAMGQNIHVVMITGNSLKQDLIKALVAGADDYIVKPIDGLDLQVHLRQAVTLINLRAENAELRGKLGLPSQQGPIPAITIKELVR